jgi:hypothetical protein
MQKINTILEGERAGEMCFLYKVSQSVHTGYDTYDSAVVCAASEEAARCLPVAGIGPSSAWAEPADVKVELLGTALDTIPAGIVCASFNAG